MKKTLIFLGLLALGSLVWLLPILQRYYLLHPREIWIGIALGLLAYSPTFLYLAWMMRGRRVWRTAYWLIPASVWFYFGPMAALSNKLFRSFGIPEYLFAGLSEESWKIMPLIVILLIGRPKLRDARDGIFYGALAGIGFATMEIGAYAALVDYPWGSWHEFLVNSLARVTFLGTDNHIVWSAFLGGALLYGLRQSRGLWRWLIPLGGFVLVVVTHSLQDLIGKRIAVSSLEAIEPMARSLHLTPEQLAPWQIPLEIYAATVDLLLVNIVILPLLIWMILRSRS